MKIPRVPQRTTPSFAFSMVERALQEGLGLCKFRPVEVERVLAFFGNDPPECVYCGSREVERWDHLVPIREGGETVIGNMVPACARCDDSKRNAVFEEWMVSDCKHSPKSRGVEDIEYRVERIKEYMRHFGYAPRRLDERLDVDEKERLDVIRAKLQEVRREIESFIEDYRVRREG